MTDLWLEKARGLAAIVTQYRDQGERERRLPDPAFEALRDAGLLALLRPKAFGGHQTPVETAARVAEELARYDGAIAWNQTILSGNGFLAEYLPPEGARDVFGDPASLVAGSFTVKGRGEAVDGGFHVTG